MDVGEAMTPEDARRRDWYQEMAEYFGECAASMAGRWDDHTHARLAAHFGRLAMEEKDDEDSRNC